MNWKEYWHHQLICNFTWKQIWVSFLITLPYTTASKTTDRLVLSLSKNFWSQIFEKAWLNRLNLSLGRCSIECSSKICSTPFQTSKKVWLNQGLLDDLHATLVSEVYISRQSFIYSLYSIEYKLLQESQNRLKLVDKISE